MKKSILSVMIVVAMMTSCTNNGKMAETKNAEKVEIVKGNETKTFNTLTGGSLSWRATHLGGTQPRFGQIYFKDASVLVNSETLTNATFIINMATLSVESFPEGAEDKGKLTGHLLSPDFFNIEEYPTSKFELTSLKASKGDFNSVVTGNLTILGVSKSITFSADITILDAEISIISENFSVDRTDWGLTYNVEGSEGIPVDYLIANDIGFKINVTLKK